MVIVPADNLEFILNNLGHRREAVRRAGSVRNDVVLRRVVLLVIHAQNDGNVFVLCRRRDDDFLHRSAQVLLGFVGIGKAARRLDHNLRAYRVPRQGGRIFLFEDFDGLAIDRDAVGASGYLIRQVAEHRVIFQQMGQRFRIRQIVDRDEIQGSDPSAKRASTLRPIRPKPLMPTLIAISSSERFMRAYSDLTKG